MAEKGSTPGAAAGKAPAADRPDVIRNVVLVGPSGAGKTTLAEALLVAAGTIPRAGRVEDGTTVSDYDEAEVRQQRSIGLSLAPFGYAGCKVNLLDTPGYTDFVGEVRAGLRAADSALFVVSASDGVDGATRALWSECGAVDMPRAVVVTKLDHQRADYSGVLEQVRAAFGDRTLPLYLPVAGPDGAPTGLVGALSQRLFDYAPGDRTERDADADQLARLETTRTELVEAVIEDSEDEELMERYVSGEEVDAAALVADLEKAVTGASLFPVVPACPTTGLGVVELLELLTSAFPSPLEHPLPDATTADGTPVRDLSCDPAGPLLAEVVKTSSDPYVGRLSLVRVFSGTVRPDSALHVAGHFAEYFGQGSGHSDHEEDERVGSLSSPLGKTQRTISACIAGDLCAIGRLSRAETGDTLSERERPLLLRPWSMPEPLLPTAVQAHAKADEDKLSQGLSRLAAEDPTLRVEHNAETHQVVLWCMGEAHIDVLLDRLRTRFGVTVDKVPLRVPLRETFASPAKGHGRHVKQTGGHGQFAVCDIEVEPLPEGSGLEFVDKVVGGAVPRQFIPSVEKGVRAQMARGVAAGYPVVDIRVRLVDGKAHSVDSSDMAFQLAGALALREAAAAGTVSILEPVDVVSVLVDDDYLGATMSDLSGRRGRVLGTETVAGGRSVVKAEVPQVEITRYAIDLRSMSHGTGTFSRQFARYEAMPAQLAQKLREEQAAGAE